MFFEHDLVYTTPPVSPRAIEPYSLDWQFFISRALQELIKTQELNPHDIEMVLRLAIFDEQKHLMREGEPRSAPLHELQKAYNTENLLAILQEQDFKCTSSLLLSELIDYYTFSGEPFKAWIEKIYVNHPLICVALHAGRERLVLRLHEEVESMSIYDEDAYDAYARFSF